MLRSGIIGTHTISDQMIHAAQDTGKYQLTAVYSRKLSTAEAFGNKYRLRDTLIIDSIFDTKTYLNNQGNSQVIKMTLYRLRKSANIIFPSDY